MGAPEADTEQKRWGVEKPGAVFRCETNLPYRWVRIEMIPTRFISDNYFKLWKNKLFFELKFTQATKIYSFKNLCIIFCQELRKTAVIALSQNSIDIYF